MSLQLVGGHTVVAQVPARGGWMRSSTPALIAVAAGFALIFGYVLTQGMRAFRDVEPVAAVGAPSPSSATPLSERPSGQIVVEPAIVVVAPEPTVVPAPEPVAEPVADAPPVPSRARAPSDRAVPARVGTPPEARPMLAEAPAPSEAPSPSEPAPLPAPNGLDVRGTDLKNPFQ